MTDARTDDASPRFLRHRKSAVHYVVQDCGYETPCWVWQGAQNSRGYGRLVDGDRFRFAHRVYWESAHGEHLPDEIELHHLCENHSCVNPSHTEPLTRLAHALKSRSTRLSPADIVDIRRRTDTREPQRAVAKRYGVSVDYIGQIHRRKRWTFVPEEA